MPATFLLSFDCEGKWGFADGLNAHQRHTLGHDALSNAYARLLECLAQHQIRASFAFVAALTLSPQQAAEHPEWFIDTPMNTRYWLKRFRHDWQQQRTAGWFEPQLLQQVRAHPEHEIACHGFCHLPLSEALTDRDTARWELRTAQSVAEFHGLHFHTLVYPRNLCGHLGELAELGFSGYRQGHSTPPQRWQRRLANLATECWPRLRSEAHGATGNSAVQAIPAGHFLNWRHGPRRHIPIALTVARWRHALEDALRHDGVVHLWSHPHNFIDGEQQTMLLEHILALVAEHIHTGALHNPTLADYCRHRPGAATA